MSTNKKCMSGHYDCLLKTDIWSGLYNNRPMYSLPCYFHQSAIFFHNCIFWSLTPWLPLSETTIHLGNILNSNHASKCKKFLNKKQLDRTKSSPVCVKLQLKVIPFPCKIYPFYLVNPLHATMLWLMVGWPVSSSQGCQSQVTSFCSPVFCVT